MKKLIPFLWFDGQAEEAAKHYVSIFKGANMGNIARYGDAGPGKPGSVLTASFEILGQEFVALNGGPQFKFTEAISFQIPCETQEEVDHYWNKLGEGGELLAVRLAEGQVRPLLAGGADRAAQADGQPRQEQGQPRHAGDAEDAEARHPQAGGGGQGLAGSQRRS